MHTSIDGRSFCKMIVCGANCLEEHKQIVDELNVFPVPDGDTGTNMSMTVMSAAKEVRQAYTGGTEEIPALAKALSSGALRGARGNSGVITSQLFRGMYRGLKETQEIGAGRFAEAMSRGVETAYKAVMRPKEGTILTVAREMAAFALNYAMNTEDVEELLEATIAQGWEVLRQTPDMLPVLKEAGVVDAGGQGFLYVFEGMLNGLRLESDEVPALITAEAGKEKAQASVQAQIDPESIKFGYCTEFIVQGVKDPESHAPALRDFLESIGDSLVLVTDDDIIKIHVHTNDPGKALQRGLALGQLINIKIENMRQQHHNLLNLEPEEKKPAEEPVQEGPAKEIGFITVSVGAGIASLFTDLGVDYVIPGGQTMNPSTEDVLNAIAKVNAENVVILPNNKNIILAAQQAADLTKDKKVYVVGSRSIPQGITAMLNYGISDSIEENIEAMKESLSTVVTGQMTFAVRDTHMNNIEIHKDDYLAILDDEVNAVGTDQFETMKTLLDSMMENLPELITFYCGEDADASVTERLETYLRENYPGAEVEVHDGGQPLYYYIISAE